jgi:hypothetical protein
VESNWRMNPVLLGADYWPGITVFTGDTVRLAARLLGTADRYLVPSAGPMMYELFTVPTVSGRRFASTFLTRVGAKLTPHYPYGQSVAPD